MTKISKPKDSSKIAAVYNKHGEHYHKTRQTTGRFTNEHIDMPTTFSLIPKDLRQKTILDAGCGSGVYSIKLAKRGADVKAIDISEKMIEIAKAEQPSKLAIEYTVGDLYNLPYKDKVFDIIFCTYVIDTIKDIDKVMAEFFRVLKREGQIVISISHPVKQLSEKHQNGLLLQDYFDKSIRVSDFGDGMKVDKYKRNFQDFTEAFFKAGFVVSKIKEPQPIKTGAKFDNEFYQKAAKIPYLLVFSLRKI